MGTGTAVKYSNGDRTRCRTRVRTRLLLPRQRPRVPGRERSFELLSRKNALPFSPVPTCPAVSVHRAGSAVPRLTLAADAGGQPGLVLSVVAGIVPVLMDQMGAGARSHPVRRRPGLTACAATRAQRQARRSTQGGALVQPGQVPGVPRSAGGCWRCRFKAGSARRNGPGCGWLARGRPYVLPGCRYRTRNRC
jgi:hypothetical protein